MQFADPLAVQLGERLRELQMAEVLHSIRFPNSITSNSAGIPDDRFLRLAPLGMPKMCAAYIESLEATRAQLPPWTSNSPDIPPEHAAFLRELGSLHTRWTSEAKSSPLAIKYVLKGFTAAVEDVMTSWKHSLGFEMSPETTVGRCALLIALQYSFCPSRPRFCAFFQQTCTRD